jgi:hypothetical protein
MVKLFGADLNNQTSVSLVASVPNIFNSGFTVMRFWSFDNSHIKLNRYPPDGEGYTILFYRSGFEDTLEIDDFLNLFNTPGICSNT